VINVDGAEVLILLDRNSDKCVAVGELLITYFHTGSGATPCSSNRNMVQVGLVTVMKRDVRLPIPVSGSEGTVICSTLGEAYDKSACVWWMERDTAITD
jgi:hypothetical protein